eukprot:CAMPEP_0175131412 /NCGR_PEP_ID=MMETSP0087-20121206/6527_1 /TAXON_ID=136419 /ORGANISM="Unknown Unknown, Strain D1" /LENGTH=368 /DNA_ID=CAMNT_0016413697 /DNA_START=140 /DNA_END=1246 /DNA_ORIENTATION=-
MLERVQMRTVSSFGFGKEQLKPELVLEGAPVKHMAFGAGHGAIVDADGKLYMFGSNKHSQLGIAGVETVETPIHVPGIENVVVIECGKQHSIAVNANGEVFTWGHGGSFLNAGALGHKDAGNCEVPTRVAGLPDNVVSVAAGAWFCLALTENGEVWSWGRGENGVLGTGSSADQLIPKRVEAFGDKVVEHISCGPSFSAAITDYGDLYLWGKNDRGQLAQSDNMLVDMYNMEAIPSLVAYFDDEGIAIRDVYCGNKHTVACSDDHELYQWGMGQWLTPNLVKGDDGMMNDVKIEIVAAGQNFSAAVDDVGRLWTWGNGKSGCLGHGDTESVQSPAVVAGFGPTDEVGNIFGEVQRVFAGNCKIGVIVS